MLLWRDFRVYGSVASVVVGALVVDMTVALRPFVYITRALGAKGCRAERTLGEALALDVFLSVSQVVPCVIIRS